MSPDLVTALQTLVAALEARGIGVQWEEFRHFSHVAQVSFASTEVLAVFAELKRAGFERVENSLEIVWTAVAYGLPPRVQDDRG